MQSIALENENQQIEQIHLLDALVRSKRFLHVRSLGVRLNLTVWFILTLMVQIWRYNNKQRLAKTGEPPFLFVTVRRQVRRHERSGQAGIRSAEWVRCGSAHVPRAWNCPPDLDCSRKMKKNGDCIAEGEVGDAVTVSVSGGSDENTWRTLVRQHLPHSSNALVVTNGWRNYWSWSPRTARNWTDPLQKSRRKRWRNSRIAWMRCTASQSVISTENLL